MILCVRAQPDTTQVESLPLCASEAERTTHVEGLPSLLQTVTVTSFLPDAGR